MRKALRYPFDYYVVARTDAAGETSCWVVCQGDPQAGEIVCFCKALEEALERAGAAAAFARASGAASCVRVWDEALGDWRIGS